MTDTVAVVVRPASGTVPFATAAGTCFTSRSLASRPGLHHAGLYSWLVRKPTRLIVSPGMPRSGGLAQGRYGLVDLYLGEVAAWGGGDLATLPAQFADVAHGAKMRRMLRSSQRLNPRNLDQRTPSESFLLPRGGPGVARKAERG